MLLATTLLTRMANNAMYKQLEGVKGNVYAILRSIKRGWIVEEEPVAFNRKQDLVYRLVGRPGIVLISEGPSSRAGELLNEQERKCHRVAPSVPIHKIQAGQGKNQVPISKLLKTINHLKKEISKDEVPIVGQRLQSLQNKAYRLPGGVDPNKDAARKVSDIAAPDNGSHRTLVRLARQVIVCFLCFFRSAEYLI